MVEKVLSVSMDLAITRGHNRWQLSQNARGNIYCDGERCAGYCPLGVRAATIVNLLIAIYKQF